MHYEADLATTEAYIRMLAEHGVTVLRIMLEYCQDEYWFFEDPVGHPLPGTSAEPDRNQAAGRALVALYRDARDDRRSSPEADIKAEP